jgi:hypothetical protein
MPFSEDDLRQALRRKDPGPEFTRRVMARLNKRDTERKPSLQQKRRAIFLWLPQIRFAPALACALVLALAVGAWIGYQSYQQHEQEVRIAKYQQKLAEERAKQETILALRISSEKLNHVFRKVNSALPPDVKIRRERL